MKNKNSNIKTSVQYDTQQKVLSFDQRLEAMKKVQEEINDGWRVVNCIYHQNNYVVILEQLNREGVLYIPARKKIRIKR